MSVPVQQHTNPGAWKLVFDAPLSHNALPGRPQAQSWLVAQAGHTAAAPAQSSAAAGHGAGAAPESTGHEGSESAAAGKYLMPHEVPNIATIIESVVNPHYATPHGGIRPHPSEEFHIGKVPIPINPLFAIFYAILIVWVIRAALRRPNVERPGKLQNAVEALLGGLRNFFVGIMGHAGEKYVPYVGSLWLFIWINNLMALVPGFKAPTSSFKTTVALGLCTFFYVQYNAIKASGIGGWLYHLLGSPTDGVTWALSPLFFFLEVIGELVKPVSLSLRLFGNIFGEDKLLASFLGMGMMIVAALMGTAHPPIGVPLHVIFYPLVVLTSTIQATVFALLASIYIVLLLPHEEHEAEPTTGPDVGHKGESVAAASQV
jgi:F-type H+-transporting ATPase subunit a